MTLPDPHADNAALIAAALPGWSCSTAWRLGWGDVIALSPPGEGPERRSPDSPFCRALIQVLRDHAAYRAKIHDMVAAARTALVGPALLVLVALFTILPARAEEGHGPSAPMCKKGEAMPEADLFALLEKGAGEKVETMHSAGPEGHLIITLNALTGTWSELLADGGTACLLRYGTDQDTPA